MLRRFSRTLIAVAARLVPTSDRDRFRREWDAELVHAKNNGVDDRVILRYSLGAAPHALRGQ